MKLAIAAIFIFLSFQTFAQEIPAHAKKLIEEHKAIAAAHEASAQCLASGKKEETCHHELSRRCEKFPVIGSLCGMRKHRH
jgi:hypothetical protein